MTTPTPDNYRALRKTRGTQETVAAQLGIARETVVRREAGDVEITREMMLALEALPKTKRRAPGHSNASGEPCPPPANQTIKNYE
jgi:DNA-binding XRE family transcriptional regulator